MRSNEPDDEISQRREEYTHIAYLVANKKYEAQKRAERKARRKDRLKSWGIIVGIIAGLTTIVGGLYSIFSS